MTQESEPKPENPNQQGPEKLSRREALQLLLTGGVALGALGVNFLGSKIAGRVINGLEREMTEKIN